MKRWSHVFIGLAVMLGIATYLHLDLKKEEKTEEVEKKAKTLLSGVDFKKVRALGITNNKLKVMLVPSFAEGTEAEQLKKEPYEWDWNLKEPIVAEAESTEIQGAFRSFIDFKAHDEVADNPTDLNPFGLAEANQPTIFEFFDAENKRIEALYVGKENPNATGFYSKLGSGSKVYLTEMRFGQFRDKGLEFFRRKALFNFLAGDAQNLEIQWQKRPVLNLQRPESQWQIIAPEKANADQNKVTQLLNDLRNIRIHKFISDDSKKDAAKYGLQKPQGRIRVSFGKDPKTDQPKFSELLIGKPTPKGVDAGYYVQRVGTDSIYELQTYNINYLTKEFGDLVDAQIGAQIVDPLDKFLFVLPKTKQQWSLTRQEIEGMDGVWQISENNKIYRGDQSRVDQMIRRLRALSGKKYAGKTPTKDNGLTSPQYVFEMRGQRDGKEELYRYEFARISKSPNKTGQAFENQYFVRGGTEKFIFEIEKTDFDFIEEFANDAVQKFNLRERKVFGDNLGVSAFTLQLGNQEVDAEIKEGKWVVKKGANALIKPEAPEFISSSFNALMLKGYAEGANEEIEKALTQKPLKVVLGFKTAGLKPQQAPKMRLSIGTVAMEDRYPLKVEAFAGFSEFHAWLDKGNVDAILGSLKPEAK